MFIFTNQIYLLNMTEDKYKILQHGFDKNSFRQITPGKKKEQRLLNKLKKK